MREIGVIGCVAMLAFTFTAQAAWMTTQVCGSGETEAEGVTLFSTVCWTEAYWVPGWEEQMDPFSGGGGGSGAVAWFYDEDGDGLMDCWSGVTDGAVINSPYGQRPDRFHYGVDIGSITGSFGRGAPIRSIGSGQVIESGVDPSNGEFIRIRHLDGRVSTYSHLLTRNVGLHAWVGPGFTIGTMNCTGSCRSSVYGDNAIQGTHLHLEVRTHQGAPRTPEGTLDPVEMMSECD